MIRVLKRLKQAFLSRPIVCAFREVLNGYFAELCCLWRWRIGVKTKPHGLSAPLVITLTSHAQRFQTLHFTLRCLLRQTIQADRIVLWVSEAELLKLPENVLGLKNEGLEIQVTAELRSYTKILPALDAFPNAYLCSADDDVFYRADWLEELVQRTESKTIVCHRAHDIRFSENGRIEPYLKWDFDFHEERSGTHVFPTGVGGILYPPGILAHELRDRQAVLELAPLNDDIGLFWIGRRNGARYKRVGKWRPFCPWPGSQQLALWRKNVQGGENEIQIARLVERFGLPVDIPSRDSQS